MQIKQCFGALRRVEARIHIYAPTLRGIQLNLLNTVTHSATHGAKFLLRRTHCLEWATRVLRLRIEPGEMTTYFTLLQVASDKICHLGVDFFPEELRADTASVHTPTITLKNAALLSLIGTMLLTALLVWNLVFTLINVLRDLVPAVSLFSSLIYAFGSLSVMVFFFVFHRAQQS